MLVCATVGPWVMRDIMHAHAVLPNWFLAAFAGATMFMMIAMILQPGLIAMNRHKSVMIGWSLGVVVTLPVFAISGDTLGILGMTALAALVGPLATAIFLALDLWWSMRRRAATPTPLGQTKSPNPATSTLH